LNKITVTRLTLKWPKIPAGVKLVSIAPRKDLAPIYAIRYISKFIFIEKRRLENAVLFIPKGQSHLRVTFETYDNYYCSIYMLLL